MNSRGFQGWRHEVGILALTPEGFPVNSRGSKRSADPRMIDPNGVNPDRGWPMRTVRTFHSWRPAPGSVFSASDNPWGSS